jgi:integrase
MSLKAPEKGQRDFWDTTLKSFGVRVSQGGSKTFILKRDNRRITIGRYPVLSLSEARTEAKRIMAEATLGRLRPHAISFAAAVDAFLEERAPHLRPNTLRSYTHHLKSYHFKSKLGEITQHDITRQLKALAGRPSAHNHAVGTLIIFFGWCIKREYVTLNPALHLPQFPKVSRSRVLSDEELARIWKACEHGWVHSAGLSAEAGSNSGDLQTDRQVARLPLSANFCTLVKLLILCGQRVTETASIQTSWLDLKNNTLTIPAAITKNGREHCLPVGTLGLSLLTATGQNSQLCFPARGQPRKPFSNWSKGKAALDKVSGVSDWVLHSLRHTFRTIHARIGTPPHIAERLVNHVSSRSAIEKIYDHHTYMPEMRAAVERYESHIRALIAD